MIRFLSLILLMTLSIVASAQAPSNYTNINGRYRWIAGMFDSTFSIPKGTTPSLRTGGSTNPGAIFYNTTDSSVYTYTGTQWIKLRGVIIDTTSLSNRINLKLNISDTAAMLAPYLRKVDTASLSNRINLKLNISDTATMLGNYLNNVGYGLIKAGQIVTADSATLASYFLRRKDSLTTTNPLGYVTRKILADTAAAIRSADAGGTVTSVGLTMPVAFNVSNSPVTSSGTIAVTGAGLASQYVRGDGTLGDLPSGGGGGASVSYYMNGSVNQGTFGGNIYYELNKNPIIGAGTDFTINANGYIAQFLTDANDPALLNIPGGNWNLELYFSASSGGGTPSFYVELYKYNGTTFTLLASNSGSPEIITGGTAIDAYFTSLAVPTTTLTLTDRLAIRVYVTHAGRTITLHTENSHLCQVITTFTTGLTALNGLTEQVQFFTTGTTGTDFNISSSIATHTFNLPTASATNRGALSSTDWTTFNNKVNVSDTASMLSPYLRKVDTTSLSNRINLKVNISDTANMLNPYLRKVDTASLSNRINTKLNISDTATMLGNYVNNVGYGLSKVSQVVSADSATLASYFLRRKDSLTATNLLGYVTGKILADTAAAVRAAAGTIGGSGTTNRVSKFTASGTIGNSSIADSSSSVAMTILSNGNIGINTTASNERLEIVGTSRFTRTTSPSVHLNLSMENGFAEYDARGSIDHVWETSGIERMRLTFGGNLGVGTASPDSMLTVLEGARFQRGVRMSGLPSAPGTRALRIDANGTLSVADTTTGGGGGIGGSGTTNRIAKFTASGTIGNSSIADSSSSVAMTISSLGNVGIGTTSPASPLSLSGSADVGMRIKAGSANLSFIDFDEADSGAPNGSIAYNNGTNAMTFATGGSNAERMRITSGGNVGIGTTTIGSRLQVNGNAAIGYSASTAAPTNGLAVSGNVGVGISNATFQMQLRTSVVSGFTGFSSYDKLVIENGNANEGANIQLVANGTNGVSEIGFSNATRNIGLISYNHASGAMNFGTANTTRFTITSGGTVIVGNGETAGTPSLGIISGTGGSGTNIAGAEFRIRGGASTGNAAGGPITFYTSAAGSAGTGVNAATERMRITSAGIVGIGLNNPSDNLHVYSSNGPASAIQDPSGVFRFATQNGISYIQSGLALSSGSSAPIAIGNIYGTAEWARISSSGIGINTSNIGSRLQVNGNAAIGYSASTAAPTNGLAVSGETLLGTTTDAGNFRLQVNGAIYATNGTAENIWMNDGVASSSLQQASNIFFINGNASSATHASIVFRSSSAYTERMRITSGGDVLVGLTSGGRFSVRDAGGNDTHFGLGATYDNYITAGTSGITVFRNATTERMRITSGGLVGIATNAPTSTLHSNGSIAAKYVSKTATYTLDSTDYTVVFNISAAATANLPSASSCTGRIYVIKVNNTTNTDALTIDPNGAQTIDGFATYTLQCQYGVMIQSDGSNWRIIADFGSGLNCL